MQALHAYLTSEEENLTVHNYSFWTMTKQCIHKVLICMSLHYCFAKMAILSKNIEFEKRLLKLKLNV